MSLTAQYHRVRVASDVAVADAGGRRVMAVLLTSAAAVSTLDLFDAASATGTAFLELSVVAGDARLFDFTGIGGVMFPTTGIFADIGGTGAAAFVWID